ncbi:DNA damage response protein RcaA [Neurospora intermedia]|uniref:DNA damage response protein RcaA n=1 Tax=Neurospora intermedia TaxID=5142 RepID=A0ABR3D6A1_NEUIN
MWLLESDVFEDGRKWLRPGRQYLFGRTTENTDFVISDKTISRNHICIHVADVVDGDGGNIHTRSKITIEDRNSKKGTLLNGTQIRGQKVVLTEPTNELILGACPHQLRIVWRPVVLSFSFTKKEIEAGSWQTLRDNLEQLDIKHIGTYEQLTTHVVSKKRNTSKTLQALVNGKPIVSDGFITAIVEAATVPDDAGPGTPSALESTFDEAWPNAADYLPPRGDEPTERPPADYAPDERRQDVFAGYTFVFYNQKQHENLAPVVQWGKGKAFFKEVVEGVTKVDDFVRYLKEVAGEKGTGSFEDGSDGKKVVVVRHAPGKGDDVEWWTNFYTSFARHLDHRPPDQKEFLEAVLACDASLLRRRLEEDTQLTSTANPIQIAQTQSGDRMQVDPRDRENDEPAPARRRARAGGRSRFKGFDFDSDNDEDDSMADVPAAPATKATQLAAEIPASQDSQSIFVSQPQEHFDDDISEQESRPPAATTRATRGQKPTRKRALSPLPEHDVSDLLDAIAPTATAAKKRRIEAGQLAIPQPTPEPEEPPAVDDDKDDADSISDSQGKGKKGAKGKGKKAKKGDDDNIIKLARQKCEEAEALAAAERQALLDSTADDEIDYAAIRRLHIIEEFDVRMPNRDLDNAEEGEEGFADASGGRRGGRTREQDIADGRWDPRWNGRKNFKKFRKQKPGVDSSGAGDAVDEQQQQQRRPLITLEEVKPKEYGIGDDYWLEDAGSHSRRNTQGQGGQSQGQARAGTSLAATGTSQNPADKRSRGLPTRRVLMAVDSSDEEGSDDNGGVIPETGSPPPPYSATAASETPRSRAAKSAEKAKAARRTRQTTAATTTVDTTTQAEAAASSGSGADSKHGAPVSGGERSSGQPAAKRARTTGTGSRRRFGGEDSAEGSDESDDGLKFRFGRRR